jgi:hypothetical protein
VPNLQSIMFSTDGWGSLEEDDSTRKWHNASKDALSLQYFAKQPDIPAPLSDIATIRNAFRAGVAQEGGALVEVDVDQLEGTPALRRNLQVSAEAARNDLRGSLDYSEIHLQFRCEDLLRRGRGDWAPRRLRYGQTVSPPLRRRSTRMY